MDTYDYSRYESLKGTYKPPTSAHIPGFTGHIPGISQLHSKSFGQASRQAIENPHHYIRPMTSGVGMRPSSTSVPGRPATSQGFNASVSGRLSADGSYPGVTRTVTQAIETGRYQPSRLHIPGYGGFTPEQRFEEPPVNPFHPAIRVPDPPLVNSSAQRMEYRTDVTGVYRHLAQTLEENPKLKGNKNRIRNMSSVWQGDRTWFSNTFTSTYTENYVPHVKPPEPIALDTPSVLRDLEPQQRLEAYARAQKRAGAAHIDNLEHIIRERLSVRSTGGMFELRRVFKQYDSDATGTVTMEEFQKSLDEYGVSVKSVDDMLALMGRYDAQGLGKLQYNDFLEKALDPLYAKKQAYARFRAQ
eukprot:tig00001704_g9576.t1